MKPKLPWIKCTLCRRYFDVPEEWRVKADASGRLGAQLALDVHRKTCSIVRKK